MKKPVARTVGIGIQNFEKIITNDCFYVDKTDFIREWWENKDEVTLITRPRRFGKTLNMSMTEQFFSLKYAGRGDLFEGLSIWKREEYRLLQGTCPVISLSFATVKETTYEMARLKLCQLITNLYSEYEFLLESDALSTADKAYMRRVSIEMNDVDAALSLHQLSKFLYQYYGKHVIILLDEYDTPLQEAWVGGYWEQLIALIRNLFNASFKTNTWLARALLTGITRISKESIFSDLNNLEVVTTTADKYETAFGFTEDEVFAALEECGLGEKWEQVKEWYDGFTFGNHPDIYNPWSIMNFLDKKKFGTYWANTSSNSLVGKLIREGSRQIKLSFEALLRGEHLYCPVDEQIVYQQLGEDETSIWSLLLASGYLKVIRYEDLSEVEPGQESCYELAITNYEVQRMFQSMVRGWFSLAGPDYNDFVKALLSGDVEAMNYYMNQVALRIFSSFDTGRGPSGAEPERFYHGFVLGLLVELQADYRVLSNRESGFGRYDVMLEPKDPKNRDAAILEFKVHRPGKEHSLEETARSALAQIREKKYAAQLMAEGVPAERIKKYGFAFEGKTVLIAGEA